MSKDKRKGWLAKLREGDEVYITTSHTGSRSRRKKKINRITPTGIIKVAIREDYEQAFNPNGRKRGGAASYTMVFLEEVAPELERREAVYDARLKLGRVKWNKVDEKTVIKIAEILDI